MTLRLVTDNTSDWLADIQRDNELRFYRADRARVAAEAEREFRNGLKVGLWIGCVAGSFLTVGMAWIWVIAGSAF